MRSASRSARYWAPDEKGKVMNVRKFSAATSRAALHEVKKALGPDAVILSNRSIEGGVEILAMGSQRELPAEKAKTPSIDGMAGELRALRTVLQEQLGGLVWGETRRREPAQAALMRN